MVDTGPPLLLRRHPGRHRPGARIPALRRLGAGAAGDPRGQAVQRRRARGGASGACSAMGVFATIRVAAGEPDEPPRASPCGSSSGRGPFRTLRLGGGARADQIRNEVRLVGEWTHRDFLGGMRKLSIHARGGVGVHPRHLRRRPRRRECTVHAHGPIARLRFEFEQPRFFGRPSLRGATPWRAIARWSRRTTCSARARRPASSGSCGRAGDLSALSIELDYLDGAPVNSAVDRAADARLRDDERSLFRLAVVPGPADHLGSPRPRLRSAPRLLSQPVAAGWGRAAGRRLRLRARVARRARLHQLRRGRTR